MKTNCITCIGVEQVFDLFPNSYLFAYFPDTSNFVQSHQMSVTNIFAIRVMTIEFAATT